MKRIERTFQEAWVERGLAMLVVAILLGWGCPTEATAQTTMTKRSCAWTTLDDDGGCPLLALITPECTPDYYPWEFTADADPKVIKPLDPDNCGCTKWVTAVVYGIGKGDPGVPPDGCAGECVPDPGEACGTISINHDIAMGWPPDKGGLMTPRFTLSAEGGCHEPVFSTQDKEAKLGVDATDNENWGGRELGGSVTVTVSDINPAWHCIMRDPDGDGTGSCCDVSARTVADSEPVEITIKPCPKKVTSGLMPRMFALPNIPEGCCSAMPSLSLGNLFFQPGSGMVAARGSSLHYKYWSLEGVDTDRGTVQIPGLSSASVSALQMMPAPLDFVFQTGVGGNPIGIATDDKDYEYEYLVPGLFPPSRSESNGYIIPLAEVRDEEGETIRVYESEAVAGFPAGTFRITKQRTPDSSGSLDYTYEVANPDRLIKVESSTGRVMDLGYDAYYRLTMYSRGDGACGACGGGQKLYYSQVDTSSHDVLKREDLSGNVLGEYTYDTSDRLTEVSRGDAGEGTDMLVQKIVYGIDVNGDATTETKSYVDNTNYERVLRVQEIDLDGLYTGKVTTTTYTGLNGLGTACTTTVTPSTTPDPPGDRVITEYPEGSYYVELLDSDSNTDESYRTTDPDVSDSNIEKMRTLTTYTELECTDLDPSDDQCVSYVTSSTNMYGGETTFVYEETGVPSFSSVLLTERHDPSISGALPSSGGYEVYFEYDLERFRVTREKHALGPDYVPVTIQCCPENCDTSPDCLQILYDYADTQFQPAGEPDPAKAPNLTKVTSCYGAPGGAVCETQNQYFYNVHNEMTKSIDARDVKRFMNYDYAGRLWQTYTTDSVGAALEETQQEYNSDGRLERLKVADDAGTFTAGSPADWYVTRYDYDNYGRRTATVVEEGATFTTSYDYDNQDRIVKTTTPGGVWTKIERDGRGLQTAQVVGYTELSVETEVLRTSYEYDKNGNLTKLIEPSGRNTTYEYDSYDRRTKAIRN